FDADAVQLLDVGGGVEECSNECLARRGAVVEPATELAFLSAGERGDARLFACMLLDEGECLQHRVVYARGDIGAFLAADACGSLRVAFKRELPHPRPDDEEEGTGQRERRVGPERAAAAPDEREPAGDEHERGRRLRRQAERPQREPRSCERGDGCEPAFSCEVEPDGDIQDDAGSAREREQCEDEPDKGRVDADGLGDPGADSREHAVLGAAADRRERHRAHRRTRVTSTWPRPTSASMTTCAALEPTSSVTSWPPSS